MNRPLASSRLMGFAAAAILALGLAACASSERSGQRQVVWQSGDDYVRIEPQEEDGAPPNDHPARFTPVELRTLLGSIEVAERSWFFGFGGAESEPEPLFVEDELDRLAGPLARALAQAGPREDVTFAVSGLRYDELTGLFGTTTSTTGRVFHDDERLNVIFGDLQTERREEIDYRDHPYFGYVSELDRMRNPLRPGSRTEPARLHVALAGGGAGVELARVDGAEREDWLTIEPEIVLARARATPSGDDDATGALEVEKGEPERKPTLTPPAPDEVAADAGVEARLARLKRLYEQGLVSDEVYREKMREILSEL